MRVRRRTTQYWMSHRSWLAGGMLAACCALAAAAAAPSGAAPRRKALAARKAAPAPQGKTRPMTREEARVAIAMLGDAYDLLLDEIHTTYHTRPSLPVAATVLRKVQERMTELGWPRARFLAVNAIVMHPNHLPKDDFERRTVQALQRSDERIEETVDGQLRVASPVSLHGCGSCHWSKNGKPSRAGITWSVPLLADREGRR